MDIITIFMVLVCGCIKNKAAYIITLILGAIEFVGGIYLKFVGYTGSTPEVIGLLGIIVPVIMLSQKHEDTKEN
jgi:hypothetical protein